jgi:hypothetical protein
MELEQMMKYNFKYNTCKSIQQKLFGVMCTIITADSPVKQWD